MNRLARPLIVAVVVVGIAIRAAVVLWSDPWTPHHPDEHILPLEAIALWEGITPREVGWPASTTRLAITGAAGMVWAVEDAPDAWRQRHEPARALGSVSGWISNQYVDPGQLYRIGRLVSVATGSAALVAAVWALTQWTNPAGVALGALALALSPLCITHSQFVLADMAGVLFAILAVGLAAKPTSVRILLMGLASGLAAASKFHFGLWLLTPIVCAFGRNDLGPRRRLALAIATALVFGFVVIAFVPWFLINPLLAIKETAGVVGVKVGGGGSGRLIANAATIFGGLGAILWGGALWRLVTLDRAAVRRLAPALLPLILGTAALVNSAVVFDRYGLVLTPGLAVLAAEGWQSAVRGSSRRSVQAVGVATLAASILATAAGAITAERWAGESDVDTLAARWILEHVPRGRTVAVRDEMNAIVPRSRETLERCIADAEQSSAYAEKWKVLGMTPAALDAQPARLMVLNDELFRAYWCRRELAAQQDPGYAIVTYHDAPRFGALLERDAIQAFAHAASGDAAAIDVLVMNRPVDVSTRPAVVLTTRRGARVVYVR